MSLLLGAQASSGKILKEKFHKDFLAAVFKQSVPMMSIYPIVKQLLDGLRKIDGLGNVTILFIWLPFTKQEIGLCTTRRHNFM
jgi:hypothetical protein